MLRKLLKYDLRANLRIFAFVWPGMLLFSLLQYLLTYTGAEAIDSLFSALRFLFAIVLVGANIFAIILAVRRFYKGLLGREGYLMFTLPVSASKLILSKLLAALITIVVTLLVSILCSALCDFTHIHWRGSVVDWETLLLQIFVLSFICSAILQIYLSCCLGHLFRKRRGMWSVLFYYLISFLLMYLSTLGVVALITERLELLFTEPYVLDLLVIASQIILCIIYFCVSATILRKRLNLE